MPDRIGQQVGSYRLLRLLGQSDTAEVYLGQHSERGQQVAVKLLKQQLSQSDRDVFLAQARTIADLVHPNIVRLVDFGVDSNSENIPFLVMEYVAQGTLRQRYPRGARLPLNEVVSYVKQTASALQYAHERGVIHRNLKPEHLFLGPKGELLLSDFALSITSPNTPGGGASSVYLAPEQLQGQALPASDQYALGIITFELLSGERPAATTISSLREKVPSLPADVETIIQTALARNPQQRFATIQAFAKALEQAALSGDVATAFTPSQPTPPPPPNAHSYQSPVPPPPPGLQTPARPSQTPPPPPGASSSGVYNTPAGQQTPPPPPGASGAGFYNQFSSGQYTPPPPPNTPSGSNYTIPTSGSPTPPPPPVTPGSTQQNNTPSGGQREEQAARQSSEQPQPATRPAATQHVQASSPQPALHLPTPTGTSTINTDYTTMEITPPSTSTTTPPGKKASTPPPSDPTPPKKVRKQRGHGIYIAIIIFLVLLLLGVSSLWAYTAFIHNPFAAQPTATPVTQQSTPTPDLTATTDATNATATAQATATPVATATATATATVTATTTATATAAATTIHNASTTNLTLTCIATCSDKIKVVLSNLNIDTAHTTMVWNFSVTNNGTATCTLRTSLDLEDPSGQKLQPDKGTFIDSNNVIAAGQSIPLSASFSAVPKSNTLYLMHSSASCNENVVGSEQNQVEQFQF